MAKPIRSIHDPRARRSLAAVSKRQSKKLADDNDLDLHTAKTLDYISGLHPEHGKYVVVNLTENNAHCYPDRNPPPDFGWGVCRHGYGLQEFGDGYMTEDVARARAQALNEGRQATDITNVEKP